MGFDAGATERTAQFTRSECDFALGVAIKFVKNEEEARDVAQDALLKAYLHRDSFRGDARFRTWLYRVVATTALMHLRSRRRHERVVNLATSDATDLTLAVRATDATPEERVAAHETAARVEQALEKMGERYPGIFTMRFVQDLSEREIGERLGLNPATVKTRAYRARAYVQRALGGELAA